MYRFFLGCFFLFLLFSFSDTSNVYGRYYGSRCEYVLHGVLGNLKVSFTRRNCRGARRACERRLTREWRQGQSLLASCNSFDSWCDNFPVRCAAEIARRAAEVVTGEDGRGHRRGRGHPRGRNSCTYDQYNGRDRYKESFTRTHERTSKACNLAREDCEADIPRNKPNWYCKKSHY